MSHRYLLLCLAVVFPGSGLTASADQPVPQHLIASIGTGEAGAAHEDGPLFVVAHKRLLNRFATWTDAPVECLFDRESLATGEAESTVPALPISKMLNAKCYVYCPNEELPIEAIYRERLANHGVKVIPIGTPSQLRNQELQRRLLIAKLQ